MVTVRKEFAVVGAPRLGIPMVSDERSVHSTLGLAFGILVFKQFLTDLVSFK